MFTKILKRVIKSALVHDSYDVNDINEYDLSVGHIRDIGPMLGSQYPVLHDQRKGKGGILRLLPIAGSSKDRSPPPPPPSPLPQTSQVKYGYKVQEMIDWSAGLTDRLSTLEYMYTSGIASLLAHGEEINLPLYHIPVRAGYAPYGCYLRFSHGKLVELGYQEQRFYRGSGGEGVFPDHLMAMAISTIVLYTTVVLHAGVCHLYYAGHISASMRSKVSEEGTGAEGTGTEGVEGIIKCLLRVFAFRTAEINTDAMILLLSRGGLVERLFAVTHEGLLALLQYSESEAMRISTLLNGKPGLSGLPHLLVDFNRVTGEFLDGLGIPSGTSRQLQILITVSTLLHEIVGSTIGIYFMAPHILKTKILLEEFNGQVHLIESASSYEINKVAVYFTTGATVPSLLCDNLRYCFPLEYRERLVAYQMRLRHINIMWEGSHFDLRNLETSISL
jgi:hypothetical protein